MDAMGPLSGERRVLIKLQDSSVSMANNAVGSDGSQRRVWFRGTSAGDPHKTLARR
jgi:hypothetical protein